MLLENKALLELAVRWKEKQKSGILCCSILFLIVKNNTKLTGDKLIQKLQKIDIETGLEPLIHPTIDFPPPDPMISDLLKLSEARVEQLEKELGEVTERSVDMDRQV
jgi:hypothetical protein